MSGHSKWANIRIRKTKMDSVRGKIFGKLSREIIVAARHGGGDPDGNPRLRLAIQKAREASMPNDNIQRAVKRGTGELEGTHYEEMAYEGYGPAGVAVLVETLTDNAKRTVADLRSLFTRHGGNLGEPGCVAWLFERKGVFSVNALDVDEDTLMEYALDAGAEDVRKLDGAYEVVSSFHEFEAVRSRLLEQGLALTSAEVELMPKTTVPLDGQPATQMLRLMEGLEDHDDVQRVSANFDIPDEILEKAASVV